MDKTITSRENSFVGIIFSEAHVSVPGILQLNGPPIVDSKNIEPMNSVAFRGWSILYKFWIVFSKREVVACRIWPYAE